MPKRVMGRYERSAPTSVMSVPCSVVTKGKRRGLRLVEEASICRASMALTGKIVFAGTGNKCADSDPPKEVDYEFWVGPAQWLPFNACRFHKNWRWNYAFGGGQLLDWIGHHCDIAHWGMGMDYGGPTEVEGVGEYLKDGLWNTATKYKVTCKYPGDITMIIAGGYGEIRGGIGVRSDPNHPRR